MKKLWMIIVVLMMMSCVSHYFIPSKTRVQWFNETSQTVFGLYAGEGDFIRILVADTLPPGASSRVYSIPMVGDLLLGFYVQSVQCDSGCVQVLGHVTVQGASTRLYLKQDSLGGYRIY
jgi:hypothetical protein